MDVNVVFLNLLLLVFEISLRVLNLKNLEINYNLRIIIDFNHQIRILFLD